MFKQNNIVIGYPFITDNHKKYTTITLYLLLQIFNIVNVNMDSAKQTVRTITLCYVLKCMKELNHCKH